VINVGDLDRSHALDVWIREAEFHNHHAARSSSLAEGLSFNAV
jgi:hypothetical protein